MSPALPPRKQLPVAEISSKTKKEKEERAGANLDRKLDNVKSWSEGTSYAIPRPQRDAPRSVPVSDRPALASPGVAKPLPVLPPKRNLPPTLPLARREPEEVPEVVTEPVAPLRRGNTSGAVVPLTVAPAAISSSDWDDEEEENESGKKKYWSSSGFRVTDRDVEILRFLGRYNYGLTSQVARWVDTSPKAGQIRLGKMGKANLVRREDITAGQAVWTPTAAGLAVADLDAKALAPGQISLVTMAHHLGLNNIGIELERGGENLLGEEGWPHLHKVDRESGEMSMGETVLTEREISQSQRRWRKEKKRGLLSEVAESNLNEWFESGRVGLAPEFIPGNEGMFVLYSSAEVSFTGSGDHVPDMVVVRERDEMGKPASIAIELELQPKPTDEWRRILRAYKNSAMYGKLIYFTHKPSIRNALMRINQEDVGMDENQFVIKKYIPASGKQPFWG